MPLWSYMLAALVAGLLAIEREAFLQAMASRPIVAATLLGAVLGRPLEAMALGAALELFFLNSVHLGAALPDNDLFATAAASCCAGALLDHSTLAGTDALALGLLATLPAARLGRRMDRACEGLNARLAARAACSGQPRARLRLNLHGLWMPAAASAAMALAGAAAGTWLLPRLVAQASPALPGALTLAWGAFLIVAAAVAVRGVRTLKSGLYAAAAALVSVGAHAARLFVS